MEIVVKEIHSRKDLKDFVRFQLNLYKGNPYFVPPIISEEVKDLNPQDNPVFENIKPHYFLAYRNGEIVGRVAAFINWTEVKNQGAEKIRFGHFDVIDDLEVTKALLTKVEELGKAHRLKYMEGPMGASNLETAGMLTEGFDRLGTAIALYNYEYYPKHFQQLGFAVEKKWIEFYLTVPDAIEEKIYRFADLVTEKYKLKILHFKNSKELQPYIKPVFDLIDESHHDLDTFVPISEKQKEFYAKKYTQLLNPEYITFIQNAEGKLCAFAITLPSFAKALQKTRGKIFPFGWYHLLQSQRKNDTAEFVLIGVHPDYQRKGITSIIFRDAFETFQKHGIKYLETNPELEENQSVQALWKAYQPKLHKRRKTFRKDLVY
ncbi:MAG: GNAT family N-acetyltransferase [Weeksellaceae bacterium]